MEQESMRQRRTAVGTVTAAPFFVAQEQEQRPPGAFIRSAEWGRKAILAGWLLAMIGIIGYIYTMLRAGDEAGILEAISRAGALGWASAGLLVLGVATWLAGNVALMNALVDSDDETGDIRL